MSKGYGKITIDLNDIGKAIKELEQAKQWIEDCCDKLPKELAQDGADVADTIFQSVTSDEQGSSTVVYVDDKPNDYTIKASGEAVAVIEFGAGTLTQPREVESSDIEIADGSWSKVNKQIYSTKGYWFYGGHRMDGLGPHKPMLYAGQSIRRDAVKKAREVFNQ